MNKNRCKDCAHYYQHYALNERKIFRVYCGHCAQGSVKRKQPDSLACEQFSLGTPDEQAFATKEYLSKALLQYLLSLELLPPIENAQECMPK